MDSARKSPTSSPTWPTATASTGEALGTLFTQVETRARDPRRRCRGRPRRPCTWHEYRARFMTERRIRRGGEVQREQSAALEAASRASGVPCSVLLAIIGVETFYGEITGSHRVIDALATLAFDYRRAQQLLPWRARAVPADDARGNARPAGAARLVRGRDGHARSSCRRVSAARPSTAAATVTAISGATGTTCSRASATISRCTAGARASPSWWPPTSATRVSTASSSTSSTSPRRSARCASAACASTPACPRMRARS